MTLKGLSSLTIELPFLVQSRTAVGQGLTGAVWTCLDAVEPFLAPGYTLPGTCGRYQSPPTSISS